MNNENDEKNVVDFKEAKRIRDKKLQGNKVKPSTRLFHYAQFLFLLLIIYLFMRQCGI